MPVDYVMRNPSKPSKLKDSHLNWLFGVLTVLASLFVYFNV